MKNINPKKNIHGLDFLLSQDQLLSFLKNEFGIEEADIPEIKQLEFVELGESVSIGKFLIKDDILALNLLIDFFGVLTLLLTEEFQGWETILETEDPIPISLLCYEDTVEIKILKEKQILTRKYEVFQKGHIINSGMINFFPQERN